MEWQKIQNLYSQKQSKDYFKFPNRKIGDYFVVRAGQKNQFEINPETTINDERIWNIPHEAKLITYDYVSNFKGLESDIIILIDIDRSFDITEDIYVGLSRARAQLIVISGNQAIQRLRELSDTI